MTDQPNATHTIGLDFGSLSCRGVLVDTRDGCIVAEASMAYSHGIMHSSLPDGTPLKGDWYLQHPDDFTLALNTVIKSLLQLSHLPSKSIVGICVDFTASTVIPLDENFRPLAFQPTFSSRPHAWAKMWKHHGAAAQAAHLTRICQEQSRPYLDWYGGKISAECLISKVLQVFDEDRPVYDATYAFVEAADYITSLLVGYPAFSTALASAKALYSISDGYPDGDFFAAYSNSLRDLPRSKLMDRYPDRILCRPGERVGALDPVMAGKLGLYPGTAVAAGHMDGYTPMLGLGITRPGIMMMVIGTSTGIMLLSREKYLINGATACLQDTYYPGLWGYASGQASVGDSFQWFVDNFVSSSYIVSAQEKRQTLQQHLTELAALIEPGSSGLISLDWFNGNRSPIGNSRLSSMFLGLTLATRSEHIYRTLLEGTAFGARKIVEAFRSAGAPVDEIWICGGVAEKNPLMMQIYSDVLGMPLKISRCAQVPALGSAIYAAVAAGDSTGYTSSREAAEALGCKEFIVYSPNDTRKEVYESLYQEYCVLYDYFGLGANPVMEHLYTQKQAYHQESFVER